MEKIFGRLWVYVGHESLIPKPGDYYCTTIARQAVVLEGAFPQFLVHVPLLKSGKNYILPAMRPRRRPIARRAGAIAPFVVMDVLARAQALEARGRRIVHMEIGEPDFTGRTRWVYQELRDRKVALFLDKLPEGIWQLRYDLRAEVPGAFHALPVLGHAMYVPEIRCNGAEARVTVQDAK